jgi:predicted transcriptional regulator
MARTKAKAAAEDSTLKPVRVGLTPELHRLLRRVAADTDQSMSAFARHTLERVIREEAKRRGIKS